MPPGAASLPVHPTQFYEALLGAVAAAIALSARRWLRPKQVFLCWLALYAVGRFAIEFLRGDASRGQYLGLSTAQYVSLALLGAVAMALWNTRAVVCCSGHQPGSPP